MLFDWEYALDVLPALARAALITVEATALSFAVALVFGLVLAVFRMSRAPWIALPAAAFVEFIRSTPVLIQIYFLFFVLPNFGVMLPAFTTGILAFGLHYSAYCSEVYRAGLDNVPRGQWEAATALNLSPWRTFRDVIIPQAVPPVVPALGNYLVGLFKETPLLSAIAIVEMMQRAKLIGSETYRFLEPVTMVGIFFLVMSLVSVAGIRRIEAWLKRRWQ